MLSSGTLLLALAALASAKIRFPTSTVLDDADLKNVARAAFLCPAGCRVYSPTRLDTIAIVDKAGKKWKSLIELANLTPGQFVELPGNDYELQNLGTNPTPSFVFYAVEKGARNYETKVAYVLSPTVTTVTATTTSLLTVMSGSGAVAMYGFKGDYSKDLPTVFATGFDSIYDPHCRPVYQARSAATVVNTVVPVYSPIVTIDFKSTAGEKSVTITGNPYYTAPLRTDASAIFASPGYIGCDNVVPADALYTSLPQITGIEGQMARSDSNGLKVVVNGQYNIANAADALSLTINDDVQKLYGKTTISKTYDYANSVTVAVKWEKRENSKDNFALQIDVTSRNGGDGNVQSTTKAAPVTSLVGSVLSMAAATLLMAR